MPVTIVLSPVCTGGLLRLVAQYASDFHIYLENQFGPLLPPPFSSSLPIVANKKNHDNIFCIIMIFLCYAFTSWLKALIKLIVTTLVFEK